MGRKIWGIGVAAISALTILTSVGEAQAEGILVQFQRGVLCDEAGQIEEIISQYGDRPLKDVLISLNERTGKLSCGMVLNPVLMRMTPLRIVATPVGNMIIVKLTDVSGRAQFTWRPMGSFELVRVDV